MRRSGNGAAAAPYGRTSTCVKRPAGACRLNKPSSDGDPFWTFAGHDRRDKMSYYPIWPFSLSVWGARKLPFVYQLQNTSPLSLRETPVREENVLSVWGSSKNLRNPHSAHRQFGMCPPRVR